MFADAPNTVVRVKLKLKREYFLTKYIFFYFSSKNPDEEVETPRLLHTPYEERPLPATKNK